MGLRSFWPSNNSASPFSCLGNLFVSVVMSRLWEFYFVYRKRFNREKKKHFFFRLRNFETKDKKAGESCHRLPLCTALRTRWALLPPVLLFSPLPFTFPNLRTRASPRSFQRPTVPSLNPDLLPHLPLDQSLVGMLPTTSQPSQSPETSISSFVTYLWGNVNLEKTLRKFTCFYRNLKKCFEMILQLYKNTTKLLYEPPTTSISSTFPVISSLLPPVLLSLCAVEVPSSHMNDAFYIGMVKMRCVYWPHESSYLHSQQMLIGNITFRYRV